MEIRTYSGNSAPIMRKMRAGTRFRFNVDADIKLLKLVIQYNPWMNGLKEWYEISTQLINNKSLVSARAARDRCTRLITTYEKQDMVSINKSGIQEMYDERERLIVEIVRLRDSDQDQLYTIVGPSGGDEEYATPSCSSIENSSTSSHISTSTKKKDKELADLSCTIELQNEDYAVDNRPTRCLDKSKGEAIIWKLEADANIKQQEFELKRSIEEEEMKRRKRVMEEDINIKRLKVEGDLELRRKQLNLDERRLELEAKKLDNDRTVQHQIAEQQRMILELLKTIAEQKKTN